MILARNYMCSLMMISDMLSKHAEAVKSVLKKWFKINDIQLMHLLVVWYLVNLQDARCNNKDNGNDVFVVWQEGEWESRVPVMYVVTRNADGQFYIEPVCRPGLLPTPLGETLQHHIRAQPNARDKVATWCVC